MHSLEACRESSSGHWAEQLRYIPQQTERWWGCSEGKQGQLQTPTLSLAPQVDVRSQSWDSASEAVYPSSQLIKDYVHP